MATRIGFGASITFYNGETEVYSQSWATADSSIETLSLKTVLEGVTIDAPTSKTFANQWACYESGKYLKTFDDTETVADVLQESSWVSVEAYAVFKWSASSIMLASPADLESVADFIRTKSGSNDKLSFPDGFTSAIESLPTVTVDGEKVTGDLALKLSYVDKTLSEDYPILFTYGCAAVVNGVFHAFGGYEGADGSGCYRWTGSDWVQFTKTPMSYLQRADSSVIGDVVHILGGSQSSTAHYTWDGSSWTKLSVLPSTYITNTKFVGCFVLNKELYMVSSTCVYKFSDPVWTKVASIPAQGTDGEYLYLSAPCFVLNNRAYIAYSKNSGSSFIRFKVFDGSDWESSDVSSPIYLTGTVSVIDDDGYGHLLGSDYSKNNDNHYGFDGSTFKSVSTLPYSFVSGSAACVNHEIVILGGKYSLKTFTGVHIENYTRI